ncbi:MAG TPA: hypothetical protein VNI01_08005, partial [Elusimicrobiota bacterium]|nr:hypothetical protein [Elusimicrobiota bacterium]
MPDAARRTPEAEHRREATELLVAALVRGAKNVQMFSATHPSVLQDANRTLNFLVKAIGREPALTLDLKAGDVLLDGEALAPMERTKLFANALRGLGVGQVRFSDGLSAAGLIRFLGWLNARLDEKGGAQDLQRAIQAERIDGLQLTFVLSFAVPAQEQDPAGFEGLSPRELEAFLKARTLPDFAALLAAHAAKRTSPQAQRAARMLSELRRRDLTLEEFVAAFPWGVYEHRVRARFDELRAQTAYAPKARGRHPRSPGWSREAIASWAGLFDAADAKALAERRAPEPAEVLGRALDAVREILARPGDAPELRPAVGAYTRLVAELGRSGDIARLLRELDLWEALGRDPRLDGVLFATLYQRAREGAANPATAAAVVARLAGLPKELPEFQRLVDFVAFLGQGMIGPILDAVRDCPDAAVRAKACALVGQACRRVGARPLIDRLVEPDADAALGILAALEEAGDPASRPAIAGLLGHGRRAVR